MKRIGLFFCLLVLISGKGIDQQEQIKAAYTAYYTAGKNKKLDKMIELTSSETIAFFDKTVLKAKTLDSLKLVKEAPLELTLILFLRQTLTKEEWKNYSGKDLLKFNIEKSLGTESNKKLEITKINVRGKTAKCEFTIDKKMSEEPLEFKKENNQWKFNSLKSFYKSTNESFYATLKKSKLSKLDFVEKIVQNMSGKRVDAKLWNQTIK